MRLYSTPARGNRPRRRPRPRPWPTSVNFLTDDDEDEDEDDDGDEDDGDENDGDGEPDLVTELLRDREAGSELEPEVRGAEPGRARFWATREQMLALARHGAKVCGQGRPTCQFCDQPLDPEGHVCPKMNGHRSADDE